MPTISSGELESSQAQDEPSKHSESRRGIESLQDLESRIQIIDTYLLHILPRNEEWDYAKEFASHCDLLDEETQESYLQALSNMQDEHLGVLKEVEPRHEEDETLQKHLTSSMSTDSVSTVREIPPSLHARSDSERDYGIEDPMTPQPKPQGVQPIATATGTRFVPTKPQQRPFGAAPKAASGKPPTTDLLNRSFAVISTVQRITSNLSTLISRNPFALIRFLFFLVGLIAAFGRRDVKDRLKIAWDKVSRTVGMGVKVSYI